ncbi:MAG: flagellar biosynthetic protein FliO [Planctomycetes bacterium]|nr:flagellar biosynthetic protein FliO [Planctomycetota bacterium]
MVRTPRDKSLVIFGTCALGLSVLCAVLVLNDSNGPAAVVDDATTTEVSTETLPTVTKKPGPRAPLGADMGDVGRSLGSLVVVLALIVVSAVVAGRWLRKTRLRPAGDKVLEVLDAVPLGPKRQVYVISAYGRRLVVATSGEQVTLLSEFAEDEVEALAADRPASPPHHAREFAQVLSPRMLEVEA